jgi:hypothetical protein
MLSSALSIIPADAAATILADLQYFEQHAQIIFSILTKLFLITLVVIAIIYIFRVLMDDSYSIRQINVPASFEMAGHTGPVIANRIYYRIQQIIQRVSATELAKGYSTSASEADVSVDVGGMGLPIKGFIEMLGGALGIRRGRKIDADFFIERNTLVMIVKITGYEAERFETQITDPLDLPIKLLVLEAAETILKHSNDEVLQTYFGLVEQVGEKQIKLAKYRYEIYKNNPKVEVNVIAAWAWGLCLLKRYDEAEEKIKGGIAKHNKAGRIYVIWASLLTQKGLYEEALHKFTKALEQAARKEAKARIANIYAGMGNCYSKLGRASLSVEALQKAIETDANSNRPYYILALSHLSEKRLDDFYEALDKALEKGHNVKNLSREPSIAQLMDEPRMKKLCEKYAVD